MSRCGGWRAPRGGAGAADQVCTGGGGGGGAGGQVHQRRRCSDWPAARPLRRPWAGPGASGGGCARSPPSAPGRPPAPSATAEPPPSTAPLAEALQLAGDAACREEAFAAAADRYAEAGAAFAAAPGGGCAPRAADCWALAACMQLQQDRPFEALVASERGVRLAPRHWQCGLYSALALLQLGLLGNAEERLAQGSQIEGADGDAALARGSGAAAFRAELGRARARRREIEAGTSQVLMEEIQRLGGLLEDKEAGYWISCVGELSRTAEGRAELVTKGFLRSEEQYLPSPVDVARRGSYVALRYRVGKRMQRCLAAAGLVRGLCEACAPPSALRDPGAAEILTERACGQLATDRLAIVDGAFPDRAMREVRRELEAMRRGRVLRGDADDVCNPRQEAWYLPFGGEEAGSVQVQCPATSEVVRRLCGLPWVLEESLGLRLAVPCSAMLACYPPGASYRRHLDSYALQGGHEDVPRKVTILLYCNPGWTPSVGGVLRAWAPLAEREGQGPAQEIHPLAGRLVLFMSEEIWHEVTEAREERYALTLWVHDRDKVDGKL